jgi:hypothetical protein
MTGTGTRTCYALAAFLAIHDPQFIPALRARARDFVPRMGAWADFRQEVLA